MSPPLKLHSFFSKTTICRFPPPLGLNHSPPLCSNQPTTTWPQSPHHPCVLTSPPSLTPITPPPLFTNLCTTPIGPNHPTTHHTLSQPPATPGPNHPPPVGPNQPTTSWSQLPHYPYALAHPSTTTPGPNQPITPDPNYPTTLGYQPITSWPQSP